MKHSCGAILYSYHPETYEVGIILGLENGYWLPFKGCTKLNETYEETAIREIYEETSGLVLLNDILLEHHFKTKYKKYHLGLVQVNFNIVNNFEKVREKTTIEDFREKTELKFFPLSNLCINKFHKLTNKSIKHFWNKLQYLNFYINNLNNLTLQLSNLQIESYDKKNRINFRNQYFERDYNNSWRSTN